MDEDHRQVLMPGADDARHPSTIGPQVAGVPSTTCFGRELEMTLVTTLMASHETCLLTLTGPGGNGKTRLVLQV
jgi:hypothetical protein